MNASMHRLAWLAALSIAIPTVAHADEEVPTRVKSASLLATGITFASLGAGIFLPAGIVALGTSRGSTNVGEHMENGALAIGLGSAFVLAGLPMVIIGGRRVPIEVVPSGPRGSTGATLSLSF